MLQRCRLLLARSGKFECDAHVIIQPAEDVRLHIGIIFRGDQDPGCDGADTPQEESAQKPHTQHGPQNEAYMAAPQPTRGKRRVGSATPVHRRRPTAVFSDSEPR